MKTPVPWSLTDVILALAAPFIGFGLTQGIGSALAASALEMLILLALISSGVTIGLLYGLAQARGVGWAQLGCRRVPKQVLLRALFTTPLVMVAMGVAGATVAYLVQGELNNHQLDLFSSAASAPTTAVLAVIALATLVPLAEELLFRGFLFDTLLARVSPPITIAVTAGVFGIYHGEPGPIAACTVLGLYLGYLRLQSDSIWPTVVIHAGNNLVVGIGMLWYWWSQ